MNEEPRLHQNSQTVSLSFAGTLIQSSMLLSDPDELVLDYTRAMMGALLFDPAPAKVLMIGLGGGSMLKYLHRHVPGSDITTVEINQGVIDLRQDFHIPPDNERLRIICDDGAAFVRQTKERYDLILVDGFDGKGIPEALCSRAFYQYARTALAPSGLLVTNVQAETTQARQLRQRIGKTFDGQVFMIESDEGGNEIVTAVNDRTVFDALLADFAARWEALAPVHRETLAVASSRIERALMKASRPA